jgi:hypothetical protein
MKHLRIVSINHRLRRLKRLRLREKAVFCGQKIFLAARRNKIKADRSVWNRVPTEKLAGGALIISINVSDLSGRMKP